jgi:YidC/Oxa1 family membrane protein insertase
MNDIRRSILWVVFGFSMVLIWDKWQIHNGKPATFFPSATPPAVTAPAAANGAGTAPAASLPQAAGAAGSTAVPGAETAAPGVANVRHEVRTDVLRLSFQSEGGALVGAQLLRHAQATGGKDRDVQTPFTLLTQDGKRTYVAQSGLVGGSFPTHKTPMTLVGNPGNLADGQDELKVRYESAEVGGVQLATTYTLRRGAYVIAVTHEVINRGSAPVKPQLYRQLVRDGNTTESQTPFYSTFTGPAVYTTEQKYQKVEFKNIGGDKANYVRNTSDGYVAMVQHYFASAWLGENGEARENFVRKVADDLYSVGTLTTLPEIAPGQTVTAQARLFVGPQDEKMLERVAPGLELVKDYGWLTILAKPLYWLLEKIHGFVGNWGWSIVLLVVLLGAAVQRGNAQCALAGLDHRPLLARPVLHPAAGDGRHDHDPDRAEPVAARSAAGQADVVHAADLLGDVLLLPVGSGALLDHEQRADHPAASAHQPPHGRAAEVQLAEVQVSRAPLAPPTRRPHRRHCHRPGPGRGGHRAGVGKGVGAVCARADRTRSQAPRGHLWSLARRRRSGHRPRPVAVVSGAALVHR